MYSATQAFTAENAAAQLGAAFESVTCVRPASQPSVVIGDAAVAADYVASLASHYQDEVARPWPDVVEDVRLEVQAVIDDDGAFVTSGDLAAFVCCQGAPSASPGRVRRTAARPGAYTAARPGAYWVHEPDDLDNSRRDPRNLACLHGDWLDRRNGQDVLHYRADRGRRRHRRVAAGWARSSRQRRAVTTATEYRSRRRGAGQPCGPAPSSRSDVSVALRVHHTQ